MIELAEVQDRCAQAVEAARRSGADAADAVARANSSESVNVRLGKLEDVDRSESEQIGLRVFVGKRSASIRTSDFSKSGLAELASRAVEMAKIAPEDQYAGLAPADLLMTETPPELDLQDTAEPGPEALRETALAVEDAARAVEGVTNSEGGSAGFSSSLVALVTSEGFAGGYGSTGHSLSASVIAGEGADMQRDYDFDSAHHLEDLKGAAEVGQEAGERAVKRLNPGQLQSGAMPVVFDKRVSASLIGHLLGAMSGSSIARRSSFLLDHAGKQICDSAINILEEPHRRRGAGSRPFDGEGLPTSAGALVFAGKLGGWLMNMASSRQLDLAPTGHASTGGGGAPGITTSNVHCAAGSVSRDALIADIKDGVLVTELIGMGVNGVTGDYSRGASGYRIVNGEIAGPVAEFTVAGNLLTMLAAMIPADDLEMRRATNAPSLRVDGMTVAGE